MTIEDYVTLARFVAGRVQDWHLDMKPLMQLTNNIEAYTADGYSTQSIRFGNLDITIEVALYSNTVSFDYRKVDELEELLGIVVTEWDAFKKVYDLSSRIKASND
jgi:hypothetical protein